MCPIETLTFCAFAEPETAFRPQVNSKEEKDALAFVMHSQMVGDGEEDIAKMEFLNYCTNSDVAALRDTLKTFDMHRKPGLFSPRKPFFFASARGS